MQDLLQPHTDAGVLTQAAVALAVVTWGAWRARRSADLLRLVLGGGVLLGGLFVLRGMH